MSPQVYRVASGVLVGVVLIVFFAGLAHVRLVDCERRRLAIIEAANMGRSQGNQLPKDTQIVYSPSELLKKLAGPAAYEKRLIARLKEQTASIRRQPNMLRQILIDERVYVGSHVTVHTQDVVVKGAVEATPMDSRQPVSNVSETKPEHLPRQ